MIQKEDLFNMFEGIKKNTNWDIQGELLWGYFFTCKDREKLHKVKEYLEDEGYTFVDLWKNEPDEGEEDIDNIDFYWLHLEKVEVHTIETLDARNHDFYKLAKKFELDSYDGMDVGPIKK